MKLGMIGDTGSTTGFRALGITTFPVSRPSDAPGVWAGIPLGEFGVIFVTEPVSEALAEEIGSLRERALPVVSVIPAVEGGTGKGERMILEMIEKAVGSEMLFRDGEN